MDLGTYSAPSSFDRTVLCKAISEFVNTDRMKGLPKWKKSQFNSQAAATKEKLEKCAKDFCALDIQVMLAATLLMLDKLDNIKEPDKETKRLINACIRNKNFCEDILDDIVAQQDILGL